MTGYKGTPASSQIIWLEEEVKRLKRYESLVHSIATDFIDSSAEFQRNDWHRHCVSLVKEDINVKYDNEEISE